MSNITPIAIALFTILTPVTAEAKDDYVYGPPPAWADYKKLGEAAIRAKLPDPDDWVVEWPNGYKPGPWPMKGKPRGYVTCGMVRAIKPVEGGGLPTHAFAVIIDRGEVKGIDYQPKPSNSVPNLLCAGLYQSGAFPPASMMETSARVSGGAATSVQSSGSTSITPLGLVVRVMPEGAYVTGVTTGSPATTAGLNAGMVITRVNGISLAGMGEAMVKLLTSDTPTLTLETAAGARLEIKRPPL